MNFDTARTFALDVAERAANAAWQGAAGAAGPILIGANATDVAHAAWWLQALAIGGAGAVSALGSLAKGVAAGVKTGTASLSSTVAQTAVQPGIHASDYTEANGVLLSTISADLFEQPLQEPQLAQPDGTVHVATGDVTSESGVLTIADRLTVPAGITFIPQES